jgi:superfamily II DNA or RNA helicase
MFLDWALNMLGIETAVFHAGLSQKERNELQEDFNDGSKSLSGCIIFYDVGGVGINLWQDCHTVFMGTAAKNEAGEKQAMGRAIRVSAKMRVLYLDELTVHRLPKSSSWRSSKSLLKVPSSHIVSRGSVTSTLSSWQQEPKTLRCVA